MSDQTHFDGSAGDGRSLEVGKHATGTTTAVEGPTADRTAGLARTPSAPPQGAEAAETPTVAAGSHSPSSHQTAGGQRRWIMIGAGGIFVIAAAYFAVPAISRAVSTVSTDDAYVNGHVTFVAPRVPGQVLNVLVDDNDRVRKGDALVELDAEPYQIVVDAKESALAVAKVQQSVAEDQVRGMVAQARANRYKLQRAIEEVGNQIALLRANAAALQTAQAKLTRADSDYQRALRLAKSPGAISQEDIDQRKEAFRVAEAQVKQALQQVYQIRVHLGLPAQPENADDLGEVPSDLDQTFSAVREALAELLQSVAPLGVAPSSYDLKPKQVIEEFYKRDPDGNLDRIYAKIIADAPPIKLAQAKVLEAQNDLDQAKLNLSYCRIAAEIDGVVSRRNVNPGNNVVAGQSLMALRSLTEIWVDANFKETQLADLRIGQAVDLDVDMYGSRRDFKGRISGFTMGTGSTLALLPAENATGNFVKVVQRLPVRIELVNYQPDETPLFVGLSVTPYVRVKEPPSGPDAGKVLRPLSPKTPGDKRP